MLLPGGGLLPIRARDGARARTARPSCRPASLSPPRSAVRLPEQIIPGGFPRTLAPCGSLLSWRARNCTRVGRAQFAGQLVNGSLLILPGRTGNVRPVSPAELARMLVEFATSQSLLTTHYQQLTLNASYFSTLLVLGHEHPGNPLRPDRRCPAPGQNVLDDLVVCPKPHVAPWRVDLVSRRQDCCRNPTLCHVKHLPGVRPPERLTMLDAVTAAITQAGGEEADPDDAAARAAAYVRTVGRRYLQLLQQDLGHYEAWVAHELEMGDAFHTTPLLTADQRETLGLARFLWEQIEQIGAHNFAAPALLFTGVLEEITQATIYRVQQPPLCDDSGRPLGLTLGVLGYCKGFGGANWRLSIRRLTAAATGPPN